jgi:uncharacterized membrane protein
MKHRLPRPTWLTRVALIGAFSIIGFTWAYLTLTYPHLPSIVPVRFIEDRALIYQLKSPLLVMLPVVVQMSLAAVIAPLVLLLLWRARPNANGEWDDDVYRMRLVAEGVALLGFVWIAVQAIGALRLVVLWENGRGGFDEMYAAVLVTAVSASVVLGARTMALLADARRAPMPENPGVWRLRYLYVNPNDPALFVPTRTGDGWTLNLGRPMATIFMAATLGFGVIVPSFLAFQVLKGYWY